MQSLNNEHKQFIGAAIQFQYLLFFYSFCLLLVTSLIELFQSIEIWIQTEEIMVIVR